MEPVKNQNVGDNGLMCKVTLSLGLLSPPIPSFSGIRKVRKFLLNLRYQDVAAGRFQKSIQDQQHWKIQKITTVLGSMTCCKICERFKKSQEILVGVIQTFSFYFFLKFRQVICRGWQ